MCKVTCRPGVARNLLRALRLLYFRAVHQVVRAGCGEPSRHDWLDAAARRSLAVGPPYESRFKQACREEAQHQANHGRGRHHACEHIVHAGHGARRSGQLWASRVSGTTALNAVLPGCIGVCPGSGCQGHRLPTVAEVEQLRHLVEQLTV